MRRRLRAGTGSLNERQEFALEWISHEPRLELGYRGGTFAFRLGSAMRREGFFEGRQLDGNREAMSAARTLSSLRVRGLVENSTPGGEAFQQVKWGITAEGSKALTDLLGSSQ